MNLGRANGGLLGVVLAALFVTGVAHAQGVGLVVWPEPPGGTPGDTVSVQLKILNPGSAFNAYGVTLHYDPTALQLVPRSRADQEGELMRDVCGDTFYRFEAAGDSIRIANSLLCNGQSLIGPGTLLDMRFVVVGPEQLTCVRATDAAVYQDGLYVLPLTVTDACFPITTTLGVPGQAGTSHALRLNASPNPARGPVAFALLGAEPADGSLSVCDLAGRVVAHVTLSGSPGQGAATWNGKGDDGRELPAGIYTAVARTSRGVVRTHLVRLR
jgi:hypothetical protein